MQIVKDIANRVAVMQNGELIEEGSVLDIFSNPKNALTQDFITVATGIDEAMVKSINKRLLKICLMIRFWRISSMQVL